MDNCSSSALKEIFSIARALSSVMDVDALLKRIGGNAERILNAEASSIMLLDDDRDHLSFKVATGEKGGVVQKMKIRVGQGIAGTVARDRQPLIINDAASDPRFLSQMDKASGFVTRSLLCVPMFADQELIGVVEVLNKRGGGFTDEDRETLESLASLAAVSIANAKAASDQRNFFVNTIELLVTAIEARDAKLAGHSWNVAQLATAIGKRFNLDQGWYKSLYYGALLHDIGLLAIKGPLSAVDGIISLRERDPETTHPRTGAEMVRNINLLSGAETIIRHHHENFDGTGFPDGLAGPAIPLGARIVGLAEAVDEMRMSGFSDDRIRQLIKSGQETRFDPEIVGIYLKELSEAPL